MEQPNWGQFGGGFAVVTIGIVLMLAPDPWNFFGPALIILGLLLVFFSLRPTWQSMPWYKRRQERQRHGGIGRIRFTTDARLAEPTDSRWRSCKRGAVGLYSPATMVACVEAGVARYERLWDRWRHRQRLRRFRDDVPEVRCERFTDILPFVQAASSVVHGLQHGKLSGAAEDWRWEGEERTLQRAQAQLPSLPATIRGRYAELLSDVGRVLRDRAEPSSAEYQAAASELDDQIERDRYLWDPALRRQ